MSSFDDRLIDFFQERAKTCRVTDVRIGLGYTAVQVDGGGVGLAYTFLPRKEGCTVFKGEENLIGMEAESLITWFKSGEPIVAGVGLACINALNDPHEYPWEGDDPLSLLEISPRDTVGMIGYFRPMKRRLEERCKSLNIMDIQGEEGVLPAEQAMEILPRCHVVILTATSLINKTFEGLLPFLSNARSIWLMGPSTPLSPPVFKDTPVTLLAGRCIKDGKAVLEVVSQGGGTRVFDPYTEKVTIRASIRQHNL